jgi:hypothetical protein
MSMLQCFERATRYVSSSSSFSCSLICSNWVMEKKNCTGFFLQILMQKGFFEILMVLLHPHFILQSLISCLDVFLGLVGFTGPYM